MKNIDLSFFEGKKIPVLIQKADELLKENLEGKIHAHKIYNTILDQTPILYDKDNLHVLRGILRHKIWKCERNFFWNEKFLSQSGQDKIIKNHFFKNKKKGFFVEIGAFDGLEGSNCYYFENMQAWDGIAVEASKNHFSKLKKNRKCHVLNFAISSSEKEVEFYDVEGELAQGSGINDRNYSLKKFVEKDPKSKVNKYKIKTTTFEKVIPSNKIIDYLSIDIEGNEMDILETIDFTKYTIKVISVENNKPDEINFNSFFKKKNFSFFDRIVVDEVFFNNSYFKFD